MTLPEVLRHGIECPKTLSIQYYGLDRKTDVHETKLISREFWGIRNLIEALPAVSP